MSYRLRRNGRNGAVVITYEGEISASELRQSRMAAAAAVEACGGKRLLCDFRKSSAGFAIEDTYEVASSHTSHFPAGTRVAMIVSEGRLAEFADFAVTVARNRGFVMQVFRDARAASRWLAG